MNNLLIVSAFGAFVALFFSLLLTPAIRALSIRKGLLDRPHLRRKIHTIPTPRLGGIAILLAVLFPLILLLPLDRQTQGFLSGMVVIAALGLWDDIRGLDARTKLPFQLLASWMMVVFGGTKVLYLELPGIGIWNLPEWFANLFTVFCVIALINAINMIDGLDGLAGGTTTIAFGSIALLAGLTGNTTALIVGTVFAGAILGFLRYNRHPATIFMGDTGSMLLGVGLAYACMHLVYDNPHTVSTWVPVGLLALPIFDTIWAVGRRLRYGQNPLQPDRRHIHHRLLRAGIPHGRAVWILHGLTFLLCLQTLVLARINGDAIAGLTITTLALFYLILRWIQISVVYTLRRRTSSGTLSPRTLQKTRNLEG
ncbi:MAG: MraY family glycosyltransferase [Leptospirillia bacterium]